VLDADGRRIDSIPLPGMGAPKIDPSKLAKRLRAAKVAPAIEYVRANLAGSEGCMAKVRRDVAAMDGITHADLDAGALTIKARAGSLDPATLESVAQGHVVELRFQDPVPVRFEAKKGVSAEAAARGLASVPGTWYTVRSPSVKAYITRSLLDPEALTQAAAGYEPDIVARRFELPGLPQGVAGCRVALAPLRATGVLAIFADVFNEKQVVVGRRGEVSWAQVAAEFEAAGCKPKPHDTKRD